MILLSVSLNFFYSIWLLCHIVDGETEVVSFFFDSTQSLIYYIEDYGVSNFGYFVLNVPLNPQSEIDEYLSVKNCGIEVFDLKER